MRQLIVETTDIKNRNFAVSENGNPLGVYSAADERSAKLAYCAEVGYQTLDDIDALAALHGETLEEWLDDINAVELPPLTDRVSIVNANFVDDDGVHVAFDIAVDGKIVHSTLEWLDGDLNLVREGCHLETDSGYRDAVADGLGDWQIYEDVSTDAKCGVLGDIAEVVHAKLIAAHADLKASMLPALEDWWYIAKPHDGDGMYAWGSEAHAAAYCDLLDKRAEDEFGLYFHKPVSLVEALTLLRNKEGFPLEDALAELKAAEEAA